MKQIIVIEPDQISAKDKEKLTKNGYIVIEAKDPSKIVFLSEVEHVDTNTFLMSALYGLKFPDNPKSNFATELIRRMEEIEKSKP